MRALPPTSFTLLDDERSMLELCLQIAREKFTLNANTCLYGRSVTQAQRNVAAQFTLQAEQAEAMRSRFADATRIDIGPMDPDCETAIRALPLSYLHDQIRMIDVNLPSVKAEAAGELQDRRERLAAEIERRSHQ